MAKVMDAVSAGDTLVRTRLIHQESLTVGRHYQVQWAQSDGKFGIIDDEGNPYPSYADARYWERADNPFFDEVPGTIPMEDVVLIEVLNAAAETVAKFPGDTSEKKLALAAVKSVLAFYEMRAK